MIPLPHLHTDDATPPVLMHYALMMSLPCAYDLAIVSTIFDTGLPYTSLLFHFHTLNQPNLNLNRDSLGNEAAAG